MHGSPLSQRVQQVRTLLRHGSLTQARLTCDGLLAENPTDLSILWVASEVALRSGRFDQTIRYLQRARDACGRDHVGMLIQVGLRFTRLGCKGEALSVAEAACQYGTRRPALLDALGTLLTHCDEPGRALEFFQRAVTGSPDNPGYRYNLAMAERMVGSVDAAESNLDKVIEVRPDDGDAYLTRSSLRVQTADRNHIAQLEGALQRESSRLQSVPVRFALAKELEDLGDDRRSFAHLKEGCDIVRASLRYDVADDIAVLDALRRFHVQEKLVNVADGLASEECIFIIGLPRSGTTLVERIIGSHSEVYAAGELDTFPTTVIRAVALSVGRQVGKLDFVERALELNPAELGRDYLAATRPRTGRTRKFTDKLPYNFLYAGLIHRALPRARFVALRRHPMDVCYAMYKTLFAQSYPFTYSLSDIARYYVAWQELMNHWADMLGSALLTVDYQMLVEDQKAMTQRILRHCDLQWEEQCLMPHVSTKAVMTASSVQVRQPVYANSIGKWRRFAEELQPIASYLQRNGIELPGM